MTEAKKPQDNDDGRTGMGTPKGEPSSDFDGWSILNSATIFNPFIGDGLWPPPNSTIKIGRSESVANPALQKNAITAPILSKEAYGKSKSDYISQLYPDDPENLAPLKVALPKTKEEEATNVEFKENGTIRKKKPINVPRGLGFISYNVKIDRNYDIFNGYFLGFSYSNIIHISEEIISKEREDIDNYLRPLVGDPDVRRKVSAHFMDFLKNKGWIPPTSDFNLVSNLPKSLPEVAPALYKDRNKDQGIIDFLREEWMPWIEAKLLTRAALFNLDKPAYTALANWLRKNKLPDDLQIPTRSESYDDVVADDVAVGEARRIMSAWYRRKG